MEAQDATDNPDLSPAITPPAPATPAPEPAAGPPSFPSTLPVSDRMDEYTLTVGVQQNETGQALTTFERSEVHTVETEAGRLLQVEKHEVIEIATDAQRLLTRAEKHAPVKYAVEDAATFGEFWLKFLNDWSFNFASGLAYHLLMAMLPIAIATGAIVGFVTGGLSQKAQQALVTYMSGIFPSVLGQNVLAPALVLLHKDADVLGVIAVLLALYSGSRLFSSMENCFAIIYHTPTRSFWNLNLMALLILLIFILLVPVMLLASSVGLGGFFSGLIASLILFQVIYMTVPNQKPSWRKSWRGTLVAALALQVYVLLFPLYIRHFLGSYTGNTGFAIILLLFFYYFALILLLGAEVNAFYADGVRAKPQNVAAMVHEATLATDKAELLKLAQERAARRRAAKP